MCRELSELVCAASDGAAASPWLWDFRGESCSPPCNPLPDAKFGGRGKGLGGKGFYTVAAFTPAGLELYQSAGSGRSHSDKVQEINFKRIAGEGPRQSLNGGLVVRALCWEARKAGINFFSVRVAQNWSLSLPW